MLKLIKRVFGVSPAPDYNDMVRNGAMIMDVRTRSEFSSGHVKGAQNFPLDRLALDCARIKKDRVIITCCASGMRSGSAKRILKSKGYEHVFNGGGWISLQHKIG